MSQKMLRSKDIDLLKVYKTKKEPSKNAAIIKYMIFPVVAAILFLGVFGFKTYQNSKLEKETAELKAETERLKKEIASDPNLKKYNSLMKAKNDVEKYTTLYKNIESYPQLKQNTFDTILIAADVSVDVTSFSYVRESQVITLQIEASTATDTEKFIRRLKETKVFAKVDYSGYSQVEKSVETPKTESNTTDITDKNTKETDKSNSATEQALLDLLNKAAKGNTTENKETTTNTVYTATVLCTLK